ADLITQSVGDDDEDLVVALQKGHDLLFVKVRLGEYGPAIPDVAAVEHTLPLIVQGQHEVIAVEIFDLGGDGREQRRLTRLAGMEDEAAVELINLVPDAGVLLN